MRRLFTLVVAAIIVPVAAMAAPCDRLSEAKIVDGVVTAARIVAPGEFTPSSGGDGGNFKGLPSFCRVEVTLRPSADSDIAVETWMPVDGWNGKFLAVGNGGWAGSLSYGAMADALRRGYATSVDRHGPRGGSSTVRLGASGKADRLQLSLRTRDGRGCQGPHRRFYGNGPRWSVLQWMLYGRPPGAGRSRALPRRLRRHHCRRRGESQGQPRCLAHRDGAGDVERPGVVHSAGQASDDPQAVLIACDQLDGVKDGLIENPMRCHLRPEALRAGPEPTAAGCLTAQTSRSRHRRHEPGEEPQDRRAHSARGYAPGTELGWPRLLGGPKV